MNSILPESARVVRQNSGTKPLSNTRVDTATMSEAEPIQLHFPSATLSQLSPQDTVSQIPLAQAKSYTSLPNLFQFDSNVTDPLKVSTREQLTEKTHSLIMKYRELENALRSPGLPAARRDTLQAQMQTLQKEYRALIAANEDILQSSDRNQLGFETFKSSLRALSPEMADVVESASQANGEFNSNAMINADTLQHGMNFPIMMMLSNYKYQELDSLQSVLKQIKVQGTTKTQLTASQNEILKKFGMHFANGHLVNLMTKETVSTEQLNHLVKLSDSLRDAHGPLGTAGLQLHLAELGRVGDMMARALANNQALQDASSQLDELVSQLDAAEQRVQGDLVRAQTAGEVAQAADDAVVGLLETLDIVEAADSAEVSPTAAATAASVSSASSESSEIERANASAMMGDELRHEASERQAFGFSFKTPAEAERFAEVLQSNQVTAQQAPDGKWSYRYNGQVYGAKEFKQLFAHDLRRQLNAAQQYARQAGISFKEALETLKKSNEVMTQLQQQVRRQQTEVRQRQDDVRRSNEELQAEANKPTCPSATREILRDIQQQGQTVLERSERSMQQAEQTMTSVETTRNHVEDMVALGESMFGDFREAIDRAFSKLSAFFSTLNTVLLNKPSVEEIKKQYRLAKETILMSLHQQGISQKTARLLQDAKVTLEKYFTEFEQVQKKLSSNQENMKVFTQQWCDRLASEMNYHKAKLAELDQF